MEITLKKDGKTIFASEEVMKQFKTEEEIIEVFKNMLIKLLHV